VSDDASLKRAFDWFRSQEDFARRFGEAIRRSFDEVFDGQRTGRYCLDQLTKVEKTYIGTKVEIIVQDEFGLSRGNRMDFLVADQEVDAKWTMKSGAWMIPTEAVGEICLCLTADDNRSVFSVGMIRPDDLLLGSAKNKDGKRRFNDLGNQSMTWLVESGQLPENVLLHLSAEIRDRVLDKSKNGQQRVGDLFRLVQKRLISREVLLAVAHQQDGPKRARDARLSLRSDGILILGHQAEHQRIARELGLDVPEKGSWISCRVVPATKGIVFITKIGESNWTPAIDDEAFVEGPESY
jgi:hypothetical protein